MTKQLIFVCYLIRTTDLSVPWPTRNMKVPAGVTGNKLTWHLCACVEIAAILRSGIRWTWMKLYFRVKKCQSQLISRSNFFAVTCQMKKVDRGKVDFWHLPLHVLHIPLFASVLKQLFFCEGFEITSHPCYIDTVTWFRRRWVNIKVNCFLSHRHSV